MYSGSKKRVVKKRNSYKHHTILRQPQVTFKKKIQRENFLKKIKPELQKIEETVPRSTKGKKKGTQRN